MNSEMSKLVDRVVQLHVACCVSSIVERMFHHEPELREEVVNSYARMCPECGTPVPSKVDESEPFVCTCCKTKLGLLDVDYELQDVLEWHVVSDWLASKLIEHDEVVHHDVYGLTVWGRCTSGQLIAADDVIIKITRELYGEDCNV